MDPLAGSSWSAPDTVAGFAASPPNTVLVRFAAAELARASGRRVLDLGCGAARNAVALGQMGWQVIGTDLSWPMLEAARGRAEGAAPGRLDLVLAPMEHVPLGACSVDFVVAHGIWNLAPSSVVFRRAVREAARVARPGAALFVFTFSRHTLPPDAVAVAGEPFVFTQFSGQPQCFVTAEQLDGELARAGFRPEPGWPLTEYNRPGPGALRTTAGPVIYEGVFRLCG